MHRPECPHAARSRNTGIRDTAPFAPDTLLKKIMSEALAVANAASLTLVWLPRDQSWFYYPNSSG
jgi:hypothetical protein